MHGEPMVAGLYKDNELDTGHQVSDDKLTLGTNPLQAQFHLFFSDVWPSYPAKSVNRILK